MTQVHRDLAKIGDLAAIHVKKITCMEICGTHTMAAFRSGLHSLLPPTVTLISGPGCPVCVTSQGDIDQLIDLASTPEIPLTLCTYGDMLRVPGHHGSLERARSLGADVRIIYSALDAVSIAQREPTRHIVLAAVGFETTAPATAAAIDIAQKLHLSNFSVYASHKRVIPAMMALLESGQTNIDGFLCPGHVAAVMGWEIFRPIVDQYHLPCVVGGFEEHSMASALALLTQLVAENRAELINAYPEVVSPTGNPAAQSLMNRIFESASVYWRGLGEIPDSGMHIRPAYAAFDAAKKYQLAAPKNRELPGCICGQVITGVANPRQCKLFGTSCTPVHPIGPCMVSSEGTCAAWFKYKRNHPLAVAPHTQTAEVPA